MSLELFNGTIKPGSLEDDQENLEDEECESDEDESEHLSTGEGGQETNMDVVVSSLAALEGSSSVGVDSDSHANISSEDRGGGSNEVSSGSVWPVGHSVV